MTHLDARKEDILGFVVRDFVRTAFPVSSGRISEKRIANGSPATIRNIMLGLDEDGYLYQPHTSAGRVPTEKGYRYFVDNLMELKATEFEIRHRLDTILEGLDLEREIDSTFENLSIALSNHLRLFSGIGFLDVGEKFFGKGLAEVLRAPEFTERNLAAEFADFTESIAKNLAGFGKETRENFEPTFRIHGFGAVSVFFDDEDFGRCAIFSAGPKRMNYEKAVSVLKYAAKDIKSKKKKNVGRRNN